MNFIAERNCYHHGVQTPPWQEPKYFIFYSTIQHNCLHQVTYYKVPSSFVMRTYFWVSDLLSWSLDMAKQNASTEPGGETDRWVPLFWKFFCGDRNGTRERQPCRQWGTQLRVHSRGPHSAAGSHFPYPSFWHLCIYRSSSCCLWHPSEDLVPVRLLLS